MAFVETSIELEPVAVPTPPTLVPTERNATIFQFLVRQMCPEAIPRVQFQPTFHGAFYGNHSLNIDIPPEDLDLPFAQDVHQSQLGRCPDRW